MPEFYVEPMKDKKCCSVCQETAKAKGKKVLLTCEKCHAITYCGVECQSADWARHEWNCIPVMVTEFPGKGRGLVAANDIEKGDLIFKDKPAITLLAMNMNDEMGLAAYTDPEFMTSLKQQIESLPSEAKSQYYKLTTDDDDSNTHDHSTISDDDNKVLKLFMSNSKIHRYIEGKRIKKVSMLHLNIALVNHSCAPNALCIDPNPAKEVDAADFSIELRAFKNILKGEEITICYYPDVKEFGSIPRKRKTALKKRQGFDCKCPVCLGQVPVKEKTLKKLIELHGKLNPTGSDFRREAGLRSRIVDLTLELNIGHPNEKIKALNSFVGFAHLARDKDLVKKALDIAKQFSEENKSVDVTRKLVENLAKWSGEFNSNKAPGMREIDCILSSIQY